MSVPAKANRVLNILLGVLLLILFKCWLLGFVQRESRVEGAWRPRSRSVQQQPERATIVDRFGIPLAINKIGYQVAVLYSDFRTIPRIAWDKEASGALVKKYKRKEHITALAQLIATELNEDAERIEDLIYSKASLQQHAPFVLAQGISEESYYKLKLAEATYPGLQAQRITTRHYPLGRIGCHLVGYVGVISQEEYSAIGEEIGSLESLLSLWEAGGNPSFPKGIESIEAARNRLKELRARLYAANDKVGKAGVEAYFDEELRGFKGEQSYRADACGFLIKESPAKKGALPGQQLKLTISSELQAFAEELLVENEKVREGRSAERDAVGGFKRALPQPLIKGGAIVALDLKTGEVLALASTPRFDPNDFIAEGNITVKKEKQKRLPRWLESDTLFAGIWEGRRPFEKEVCKKGRIEDQALWLDWKSYLGRILPATSPVRKKLEEVFSVGDAVALQRACAPFQAAVPDAYDWMNLLFTGTGHKLYREREPDEEMQVLALRLEGDEESLALPRAQLTAFFEGIDSHADKVLLIDLCRLAIDESRFSPPLLQAMGGMTLFAYKQVATDLFAVESAVAELARDIFYEVDWKEWRKQEGSRWLRLKRKEEQEAGRYARPYIDLYDKERKRRFEEFWEAHKWEILLTLLTTKTTTTLQPYQEEIKLWRKELLSGAHEALPWRKSFLDLNKQLQPFSAGVTLSFLQSFRSYHELTRPLYGRYRGVRREQGIQLEKHLASAYYPIIGFGCMRSHGFQQATVQGSLFKLVVAYEALRKRFYQGIEPLNPLEMIDEVTRTKKGWNVGRLMDGEPIPRLYKGGRIPRSCRRCLGKINLAQAIAHSSNPYFALLASDYIDTPDDLLQAARSFSYGSRTGIELAGELAGSLPQDLSYNRTGLYSFAMGQHSLICTPLQSALMVSALARGGEVLKPTIVKAVKGEIPLWERDSILNGTPNSFKEELHSLGVNFPLFSALEERPFIAKESASTAEIMNVVDLPNPVRKMLWEGMRQAVEEACASKGGQLKTIYKEYPQHLQTLLTLTEPLMGKTSTSEVVETVDLDLQHGPANYNHIWFGGFVPGDDGIVVIVYLRFGGYGKEATPIAAEIVRKWREIQRKRYTQRTSKVGNFHRAKAPGIDRS